MRQDVLRPDQLAAPVAAAAADPLADRHGVVDAESRALHRARRGSLGAMAWVIGSWLVAFVVIVLVIVAVR